MVSRFSYTWVTLSGIRKQIIEVGSLPLKFIIEVGTNASFGDLKRVSF